MGGDRDMAKLTTKFERILYELYKEGREGVLDGELIALCGTRENYYAFRKALREMGIIRESVKLKDGSVCHYFDWDVAKKHIATRHIFEQEEEKKVKEIMEKAQAMEEEINERERILREIERKIQEYEEKKRQMEEEERRIIEKYSKFEELKELSKEDAEDVEKIYEIAKQLREKYGDRSINVKELMLYLQLKK